MNGTVNHVFIVKFHGKFWEQSLQNVSTTSQSALMKEEVFSHILLFLEVFFCLQNSITCHVPFFLFSNDDRKFKIYDNKISCYSMKSYWFSRFESMLMMMIAKILRSLRLKFFYIIARDFIPITACSLLVAIKRISLTCWCSIFLLL